VRVPSNNLITPKVVVLLVVISYRKMPEALLIRMCIWADLPEINLTD